MNFGEVRFWELLLAGLGVILLLRFALARTHLRPGNFDKVALLALGLFLLGCVSAVTLVIFLAVAVGTYVGLGWVLRHDEKGRWKYLFVLIPLQLLPLVCYKYAHFMANQVLNLDVDLFRGLVIPVGISFYTFQKVGFVVDTLHFHKPMPGFLNYMNFAGFFPQIVAGPIERRESLLPQMEQFRFRWLPQEITPVIARVREAFEADGTGFKEPQPAELADRDWRADPEDGMRPLRHIRAIWEPAA